MKFQKQKYLHKPEEGQFGDCARTALACLLNVDRDDVPNFGEHYDDHKAFMAHYDNWLWHAGFVSAAFCYTGEAPLEQILASRATQEYYYLLVGQSRSGCDHVVICYKDRIVWDTSTNNAGIIGPCRDGNYWIEVLVPNRFTPSDEERILMSQMQTGVDPLADRSGVEEPKELPQEPAL